MHLFAPHVIISFFISFIVVIAITLIAERYGTKIGGILGTLPSTIVIIFIFISLDNSVEFASEAVAVVPAEMGINIVFLFIFSSLIRRFKYLTLAISLSVWILLSFVIFIIEIRDILASLSIYVTLLFFTFLYLEKICKIKSTGRLLITYTPLKILFRGLFAGIMTTVAILLANFSDILSGIFSVFPSIFLSTMIIFLKDHGPVFTGAIGKSMILGTPTVVSYAVSIHFLYPLLDIVWGTIFSYCISLCAVSLLFKFKHNIL